MCNDTGVDSAEANFNEAFEAVWRLERARVLATLIRLLGDFDAAEEATQDACMAALQAWSTQGVPKNPGAWLVSTGRHKAIDRLRRRSVEDRLSRAAAAPGNWIASTEAAPPPQEASTADDGEESVEDDRLRLIFTCCHPALAEEVQVALTLRTLGGLSTEAIARAFLKPAATIAQRIVRAKAKIRDAGIPYRVPGARELAGRLDAVLLVIYLIFNEGYGAEPAEVQRRALCEEAIRLGRLLHRLMPEQAEAAGLLALMLLQHSRAAARFRPNGEMVLLHEQNRELWDRVLIDEGKVLTSEALRTGAGLYGIQAAIAAVHAEAETAAATDWPQIVALYDVLLRVAHSPVFELNRAVALAMASGVAAGLTAFGKLMPMEHYCPYWATLAQLMVWAGKAEEAVSAYRRAMATAGGGAQERFFRSRIQQMHLLSALPRVIEAGRELSR